MLVERNFSMRLFTHVVKAAALNIRTRIEEVEPRRFVWEHRKLAVFHYRQTDRGCVTRRLSAAQIVEHLVSYGAHPHNTTLYLMTDASHRSEVVAAVRNYYSPFFFTARDFASIFEEAPFVNNGFLVFAVELELQTLSYGYILSYSGHKLEDTRNLLGVLASRLCHVYYYDANDTIHRVEPTL